MGIIPAHPKTLTERNYQVVEKEEGNMHPRDLHEQEEAFSTMMRTTRSQFRAETVKIVCYHF